MRLRKGGFFNRRVRRAFAVAFREKEYARNARFPVSARFAWLEREWARRAALRFDDPYLTPPPFPVPMRP